VLHGPMQITKKDEKNELLHLRKERAFAIVAWGGRKSEEEDRSERNTNAPYTEKRGGGGKRKRGKYLKTVASEYDSRKGGHGQGLQGVI